MDFIYGANSMDKVLACIIRNFVKTEEDMYNYLSKLDQKNEEYQNILIENKNLLIYPIQKYRGCKAIENEIEFIESIKFYSKGYTPYIELPDYDKAKSYHRDGVNKQDENFSDCVETVLFHLFTLSAYNPETEEFDFSRLFEFSKDHFAKNKKYNIKENLEQFLTTNKPGEFDHTSWNKVVADLNSIEIECAKIDYNDNENNIHSSGWTNLCNVIQRLTGILKLSEDSIETYIEKMLNINKPIESTTYSLEKKNIQSEDLYTIKIELNDEKNETLWHADFVIENGHSSIKKFYSKNNFNEGTEKILDDWLDKYLDNENNISEEALISFRSILKSCDLYTKHIEKRILKNKNIGFIDKIFLQFGRDQKSIVKILESIDNYDQIVDEEYLTLFTENLLSNINWNDEASRHCFFNSTLSKRFYDKYIYFIISKLKNAPTKSEKLCFINCKHHIDKFKNIENIDLSEYTIHFTKDEPKFFHIKKDIESRKLTLKYDKNYKEEIFLEVYGLNYLQNLTDLHIHNCSFSEELSNENIKNLSIYNCSFKSEKLNLSNLKHLAFLSIYDSNITELKLSSDINTFYIGKLYTEKCPEIKIFTETSIVIKSLSITSLATIIEINKTFRSLINNSKIKIQTIHLHPNLCDSKELIEPFYDKYEKNNDIWQLTML